MPNLTTEVLDDPRYFGGILQSVDNAFFECDYTQALDVILGLLEGSHKSFFDSEGDPNGKPWTELSQTTVRKKGHDTILFETGKLKASLTQKSAGGAIRRTTETGLLFGTTVPYAMYHMTGTRIMPARPHTGFDEETLDKSCGAIADHLVEQLRA